MILWPDLPIHTLTEQGSFQTTGLPLLNQGIPKSAPCIYGARVLMRTYPWTLRKNRSRAPVSAYMSYPSPKNHYCFFSVSSIFFLSRPSPANITPNTHTVLPIKDPPQVRNREGSALFRADGVVIYNCSRFCPPLRSLCSPCVGALLYPVCSLNSSSSARSLLCPCGSP